MRTIRKFKLERVTQPIILMPRGAKILRMANQSNQPILWAICRDDAPLVKRLVRIFPNGHELPDEPGEYLNTIVFLGEEWHCFDGGERYE
jgi:hypothetical protein